MTQAMCEVCLTRGADWYIVPVPGGRGVDCCAVCYARNPAAILDVWRVRNAISNAAMPQRAAMAVQAVRSSTLADSILETGGHTQHARCNRTRAQMREHSE